MTRLAIVNARLLDPAGDYDGPGGVLIENGRVAQAGTQTRRGSPSGLVSSRVRNASASASKTSPSLKKDETEIMKQCCSKPSSSGCACTWVR